MYLLSKENLTSQKISDDDNDGRTWIFEPNHIKNEGFDRMSAASQECAYFSHDMCVVTTTTHILQAKEEERETANVH